MRRLGLISLFVVMAVALILTPLGVDKVQAAGSVTGGDMIALINGWRASYYSNSLIEDVTLDYCAQWTADTMNANGYSGHLVYYGYPAASERCANFGFGNGQKVFVTENWAMDMRMSIDLLASYWGDADHMRPATTKEYCYVGVGVSGNYYVLQAGYISGDPSCSSVSSVSNPGSNDPAAPQADATQDMSNYVSPVLTSTPNVDGSIYHTVQSGQFLYAIAEYYGVTVGQIKTLNNLPGDAIVAGQTLLIRLAPTVTITPTRTPTIMMPSRTPTQTAMPTTPRPTHTITPTPDPKNGHLLPVIDRQWLGLGLLILSAIGFFVVFYFFFLRPMRKK